MEDLQAAAVFGHDYPELVELESDINALTTFCQAYSQAFGLHPASVIIGVRLGYLAERHNTNDLPSDEDVRAYLELDPVEEGPLDPGEYDGQMSAEATE